VDYLVNQIIEQVQKQGAAIGDVTVSVLINKADMTPDEIANVTKIVANTAGVSTDKVALCNMQFATVNAPVNTPVTLTPGISLLSRLLSVKYLPIYALLSILPVFLIILFIIGRVRAKKRRLLKQVVSEDKKVTAKEDSKEGNVDVSQITETKEQQLITEIRDFSMKAPQITAMLIRTLLKGDFE
jgi:flagellar biosynthesis/type III secretory pathway M-ring protein FliF/YscJ